MSADVGWSDDPVKDPEADNLNRDGLAAETAELIDRVTASKGSKVALHDPGCSRGLNPPVSSRDLAM